MQSPSSKSGAESRRFVIVGAGVAGLAAARELVALGHSAVVLDKGRGPGGRTSVRRALPHAFDHGAQYFTARDDSFRRALQDWLAAGVVAPWDGQIVELAPGAVRPTRGSTERFVGSPHMNALAKHLAHGLETHSATRVGSLERSGSHWNVFSEGGTEWRGFDGLLLALPSPQAGELIGSLSSLGARAAAIEMQPCWAVLLGLSEPYDVAFDGAFCESETLSWVCRDNSKPGRPPAESWVLHATREWTERHFPTSASEDAVIEAASAELERLTGVVLPTPLYRSAHFWRYSQPNTDFGEGFLLDPELLVAFAGDAYCGGRVEGAFLSGVAAARALHEAATSR